MVDLASLTISGKVSRIAYANKNDPDSDTRSWIIWLESQLKPKTDPVLVRFTTNQKPVPWLLANNRIYPGFEMTITGSVSSVSIPTQHTEGKVVIHVPNATVCLSDTLYYERTVTYKPSIPQ